MWTVDFLFLFIFYKLYSFFFSKIKLYKKKRIIIFVRASASKRHPQKNLFKKKEYKKILNNFLDTKPIIIINFCTIQEIQKYYKKQQNQIFKTLILIGIFF